MANGFGTLWVGASGLQSSQNALNVTANNLTNMNVNGYVRQQVMFADNQYTTFSSAAISRQQAGLGVSIGDVVHARDIFLDRAYRSETGRQSFYQASFDAVEEVETFLQEMNGEAFKGAISDLYESFSEFAKAPGDTVNQNLVVQKSSLFLSRAAAVYDGLQDYQSIINTKITKDCNRINEIGKEIYKLNLQIQKIEAADIETAMSMRDDRDALLDELATFGKVTYEETPESVVKVNLDGTQFVIEDRYFEVGLKTDKLNGFVTPYWTHLSDPSRDDYYNVFDLSRASADTDSDIGEVKALLLARGDRATTYADMEKLEDYQYEKTLSNSIMMNSLSELDGLVHSVVTAINDAFSPLKEYGGAQTTATDAAGNTYVILPTTKIADTENCSVGSDGVIPPMELFTRVATPRYTEATLADGTKIYLYNEEDSSDIGTQYTINNLDINRALIEEESYLPHMTQDGQIDYNLGKTLEAIWEKEDYYLNPSDTTPCSFQNFYTKWIGEIGTTGSIYRTTSETLKDTATTINNNRQQTMGVSSDEELTNIIKYQNAYNASSRFINAINEMIEHLITNLQ